MLPLPPFEWLAPRSLVAALEALGEAPHETMLVAGGTDLVPNLKRGLHQPRRVLGLGRVDELARIDEDHDGGLRLGAGLTLERLASAPRVMERYPALAAAAAAAASPQLRRMGTLGGNLCLDTRCAYYDQSAFWRDALGHCLKTSGDTCHVVAGGRRCVAALAADTPAPLVAYGAEVELRSRRGARRIPLLELYGADGARHLTREPDEILTAVILPAPAPELRAAYVKLRARQAIDFPLLSVAAAVSEDDVRVVIAALGPRPPTG
ncbi:MAG: FAD binding domain-containing protein, partial [Deltaproteobacteria bacterium]|nr:FAD binding domain-containing protein [Kofleriaceae bacterium]